MKRVAKSRLMEAIHETAEGLYAGGAIDKVTMSQYDLLCLKSQQKLMIVNALKHYVND